MAAGCQENNAAAQARLLLLTIPQSTATILNGSGCVPVGALVFKISGRLRTVGGGGFDSHPLPLSRYRDEWTSSV